jgi:hypothetical protein
VSQYQENKIIKRGAKKLKTLKNFSHLRQESFYDLCFFGNSIALGLP